MLNRQPLRCWAEISRRQIGENFDAVRRLVAPAVELAPVVKADACGHGAVEVSRILCERGARWLAVASTGEGVRLREAGVGVRILVMADFLQVEPSALIGYGLTPVVHSLPDILAWDKLNRQHGVSRPYHLKVDTGLCRLGTRATAPEIAEAVRGCSAAQIEGLMTHFASAADYTGAQTTEQITSFLQLAAALRQCGIAIRYLHLSGTVPIAYGRREAWQQMVRPGHAIYGYVAPASGDAAPPSMLHVRPALTWKASILAIKDVPLGAGIGYRATYRAPAPMRLAILAAGYADGIPHQLANTGQVIAGGKLAPIVGAVGMDLTSIDITSSPHLQPGDAVTLLGSEGGISIDAQQLGQMAGTSSYSILCGIAARVKRVWV